MHGAGFTGSGEVHLKSIVAVEGTADGTRRVCWPQQPRLVRARTPIFSQIAADALGIDADDVEVAQPDTNAVPNSGPTVASRTCMVVGQLVEAAALGVKHALIDAGYLPVMHTRAEFQRACARYVEAFGALQRDSQYQPPPGLRWDDEKYVRATHTVRTRGRRTLRKSASTCPHGRFASTISWPYRRSAR